MKKFDNGDALAKEMGLSPNVLAKTFDDYNTSIRTKKDPFGKKVHSQRPFFRFSLLISPCSSSNQGNGI